ncbi:MAG: DUF948 domain-containing protein [Limosilactobacillus sp.]|uniref:DUF948 domain-containing protein n=1 Tax=Limosilactobacillus sp. TaxID=2773925 RepID=UPI0026FC5DC3|nr:DUF948 domain-containing protein [Limosilactobacillus sp.]
MVRLAVLIAAIAFVILVAFLCVFLTHLSSAVKEAKQSVTTLTRDLDSLSKEVEDVLGNTNTLLEDVNDKATRLDPAVQAVADVSQSVIDINDHVHSIVDKVSAQKEKNGFAFNVAKRAGMAVLLSSLKKVRQRREGEKEDAENE